MEEASASRTLRSPQAAQVLLSDERRLLGPFMGRERRVAEAARELGVAVDALTYRVRRFVRLGLLETVREEPRKGRAVKVYRGPVGYRVPLAVLPAADLPEVVGLLDVPMRGRFLRAFADCLEGADFGGWSLRFSLSGGQERLELAPPLVGWTPADLLGAGMPALVFNWVPLELSTDQAKALQGELAVLLGRYGAQVSSTPTHLLGLFMAPGGE